MFRKNAEKQAIRTVRRKKMQDLLAVLSFLVLLPYTCSTLAGQDGMQAAIETADMGKSERYILREAKNGVWRVPFLEYLTGALAASIPADCQPETLKAQAVILRSSCMANAENMQQKELKEPKTGYLTVEQRRQLWGADFAVNEAKYRRAVEETWGIVLCWEGQAADPPFFRLSAGRTRDGREVFGEGEKDFCRSVDCAYDMESPEFLQSVEMSRAEFAAKLASGGVELPNRGAKLLLTRDSAGYVLYTACGDRQLQGEKFRQLFSLASSCFSVRQEKDRVVIQTKGVGHGLGFDQYAADRLAVEGNDYMELLEVFFEGLTLDKME